MEVQNSDVKPSKMIQKKVSKAQGKLPLASRKKVAQAQPETKTEPKKTENSPSKAALEERIKEKFSQFKKANEIKKAKEALNSASDSKMDPKDAQDRAQSLKLERMDKLKSALKNGTFSFNEKEEKVLREILSKS